MTIIVLFHASGYRNFKVTFEKNGALLQCPDRV
jgi:hypothetical protein